MSFVRENMCWVSHSASQSRFKPRFKPEYKATARSNIFLWFLFGFIVMPLIQNYFSIIYPSRINDSWQVKNGHFQIFYQYLIPNNFMGSINQSINKSIHQLSNQSINPPMNQLINPSIIESINQVRDNQSIGHTIN